MKTQPTQSNERIISLDVLRGFAVLGILVVNLQAFSMIGVAFFNPVAFGNFEGINKITWILVHVFFEIKFMSIFSVLFGAGIILNSPRILPVLPALCPRLWRLTMSAVRCISII